MNAALTKHELYVKAFFSTLEANRPLEPDPTVIKKLVFYGVKALNTQQKQSSTTKEEALSIFQIADLIQSFMGILTPKEFVSLFPITKEYDGHKYEVKDYFYTKNFIESLPDEPIGDMDKVIEFLWEYQNNEIRMFLVNTLSTVSDLRRLEGQPGIMEEFCAEHGIKTFTMHTGQNGKQFMVDNETGKSFGAKRKAPRYLKRIK